MTRILPQHALGGMQKQTMDLCEGFVESGHRVTIFTTKRIMEGVSLPKIVLREINEYLGLEDVRL